MVLFALIEGCTIWLLTVIRVMGSKTFTASFAVSLHPIFDLQLNFDTEDRQLNDVSTHNRVGTLLDQEFYHC